MKTIFYAYMRHTLTMHPVHFHIGVYITIAAMLVTILKTSHEMVIALYGAPLHTDITNSHMREAETHNAHINLNFARRPTVSGV
jgi:hypothetical protein